jgi:uncharacterized membrane protein YgcG
MQKNLLNIMYLFKLVSLLLALQLCVITARTCKKWNVGDTWNNVRSSCEFPTAVDVCNNAISEQIVDMSGMTTVDGCFVATVKTSETLQIRRDPSTTEVVEVVIPGASRADTKLAAFINVEEGGTLKVEDIVFKGGYAAGPLFRFKGSTGIFTRVTFQDMESKMNGPLQFLLGSVLGTVPAGTFKTCTFTGNKGGVDGDAPAGPAGVQIEAGVLLFSDTMFEANGQTEGGKGTIEVIPAIDSSTLDPVKHLVPLKNGVSVTFEACTWKDNVAKENYPSVMSVSGKLYDSSYHESEFSAFWSATSNYKVPVKVRAEECSFINNGAKAISIADAEITNNLRNDQRVELVNTIQLQDHLTFSSNCVAQCSTRSDICAAQETCKDLDTDKGVICSAAGFVQELTCPVFSQQGNRRRFLMGPGGGMSGGPGGGMSGGGMSGGGGSPGGGSPGGGSPGGGVPSSGTKINCVGAYGACNSTCQKTYAITTNSSNGGTDCAYEDNSVAPCGISDDSEDACTGIDCVGAFTACTQNCIRTFAVSTPVKGTY